MNTLDGFTVNAGDIRYVGSDLQRPECVLCRPDGVILASDARGGVMEIRQDGRQALLRPGRGNDTAAGSTPNGLALAPDGALLVADFGKRALLRWRAGGAGETLLSEIDGAPLGQVNFVLLDSRDRIWMTVSTRHTPFIEAFRPDVSDGYIVRLDDRGAAIVADGLFFPNEIRFDAGERWLYVAETTGRRIRRFRVAGRGALGAPETFGPDRLEPGFPDGIAFDETGNLWIAMVMGERVIALTPDGVCHTILEDTQPAGWEIVRTAFEAKRLTGADMAGAKGAVAPLTTSIAFGGADRRTVHLGSLAGDRIATFRTPVAGLPMGHWR